MRAIWMYENASDTHNARGHFNFMVLLDLDKVRFSVGCELFSSHSLFSSRAQHNGDRKNFKIKKETL